MKGRARSLLGINGNSFIFRLSWSTNVDKQKYKGGGGLPVMGYFNCSSGNSSVSVEAVLCTHFSTGSFLASIKP